METTPDSNKVWLGGMEVTERNPAKEKFKTLIRNNHLDEDGHMMHPSANCEVNFEMHWHPNSTLLDLYGLFHEAWKEHGSKIILPEPWSLFYVGRQLPRSSQITLREYNMDLTCWILFGSRTPACQQMELKLGRTLDGKRRRCHGGPGNGHERKELLASTVTEHLAQRSKLTIAEVKDVIRGLAKFMITWCNDDGNIVKGGVASLDLGFVAIKKDHDGEVNFVAGAELLNKINRCTCCGRLTCKFLITVTEILKKGMMNKPVAAKIKKPAAAKSKATRRKMKKAQV